MQKKGVTGKYEQTYNERFAPDADPSTFHKNMDGVAPYTGMGRLLRYGRGVYRI